MSPRDILIFSLVLTSIVIALIELSIGFYYISSPGLCRIQPDIMLLMAIGGVFQTMLFAAAFGFIFAITPTRFKANAKETNRATQILLGCITFIIAACALTFFVLLQIRVYGNYRRVQTNSSPQPNYCLFTIYFGAFGIIIALYVGFILFFVVAIMKLSGIGFDRGCSSTPILILTTSGK